MDESRGRTNDIEQLQSAVNRLEQRVAALERAATAPATPVAAPRIAPAVTLAPQKGTTKSGSTTVPRVIVGIFGFFIMLFGAVWTPLPIIGLLIILLAVFWPSGKHATVAATTPATPVPAHHEPRHPSKFEEDLAKHWFSWLGIISIVVGITLLLNYAFRDYGALGRIFTGYAVGLMLMGLWLWLRRVYRGFAFVLQSGAWAVFYLSTFALHTIEQAPIASAMIGGILLLGIATVICIAALLQRSRALTVGSFFLGYVAVFTSTLDTFVAFSLLFLAVGAVVVSTKQRWPSLVTGAIIATYLVQLIWIILNIDGARTGNTANIMAVTLFFDLIIFGGAHWLIGAKNKNEELLTIGGTILNLIGFYGLFEVLVDLTNNPNGWVAPILISVVCAALAITASALASRRYLRDVYTVFAIAFVTLGLGQWTKGDTRTLVWLIEAGAVVTVGALTRLTVTRIMGYLTSIVALLSLMDVLVSTEQPFGSLTLDRRLILGLLGVVVFGGVAFILRRLRLRGDLMTERFMPEIFADGSLVLFLVVLSQQLPDAWAASAWALVAVALWGVSREPKYVHRRLVGVAVLIASLFYWVSAVATSTGAAGFLPIHGRLVVGLLLSGVALTGALLLRSRIAGALDQRLPIVLGWIAVAVLTLAFGVDITNKWLSAAWGLEGVVLYIIGFAAQNQSARRQALAVMGITIAKVYLFDVQTLDTPYQILSFILLGCILLGVGYAFNRWRQRIKAAN